MERFTEGNFLWRLKFFIALRQFGRQMAVLILYAGWEPILWRVPCLQLSPSALRTGIWVHYVTWAARGEKALLSRGDCPLCFACWIVFRDLCVVISFRLHSQLGVADWTTERSEHSLALLLQYETLVKISENRRPSDLDGGTRRWAFTSGCNLIHRRGSTLSVH